MQKNRDKARNEQALSAITQNKVVTLPTKKLNTAILMEQIKHECGVAMVRLLQPLSYYKEKYGTWMYGLNKLYLMMEKQHNRGQEAAGLAALKLQAQPGEEFMFRERAQGNRFSLLFIPNSLLFLKNNLPMSISLARISPLRGKFIWATSGILQPARVAFRMSIPFCEETIGAPKTFVCVPISI